MGLGDLPDMGLLDTEAGKRRLLSVEIPVVERYNEARRYLAHQKADRR